MKLQNCTYVLLTLAATHSCHEFTTCTVCTVCGFRCIYPLSEASEFVVMQSCRFFGGAIVIVTKDVSEVRRLLEQDCYITLLVLVIFVRACDCVLSCHLVACWTQGRAWWDITLTIPQGTGHSNLKENPFQWGQHTFLIALRPFLFKHSVSPLHAHNHTVLS